MVPEDGAPTLAALLDAVGDQFSARVRKTLTAYVAAGTVYGVTRTWWQRGKSVLTYTVTVDADDDLYAPLHRWVLARVPPKRQRALVARSHRGMAIVSPDDPGGQGDANPVDVFYDGRRVQPIRLGSFRITVAVEQESGGGAGGASDERQRWAWKPDRIVFTCYGVGARDAVLDVLRALAEERRSRTEVRLFVPRWESWNRMDTMPRRSLDAVVLAAGQKEDLVDDVARFLAAEADYVRLGLPWHRGYLLTGPPGVGKTSVAKALAEHFHLDIYYLALSAVPNDAVLQNLLTQLSPRSVLLIEDIDIVHGARERDDTEKGVTLGGLLNGLDGVLTPHGLITVLTSNDVMVLDDALVRKGRVDRMFELGYLDDEQAQRLVAYIVGAPIAVPNLTSWHGQRVTPADVVEKLKAHLNDVAGAEMALDAWASEMYVRDQRVRL